MESVILDAQCGSFLYDTHEENGGNGQLIIHYYVL